MFSLRAGNISRFSPFQKQCHKLVMFGPTVQGLDTFFSVQGAGRHKETDDEGSPPPAEEGRVPPEEREAKERPHPQDLPECR